MGLIQLVGLIHHDSSIIIVNKIASPGALRLMAAFEYIGSSEGNTFNAVLEIHGLLAEEGVGVNAGIKEAFHSFAVLPASPELRMSRAAARCLGRGGGCGPWYIFWECLGLETL